MLFWDDGVESNVYIGTNDAARTRFRFQGEAKINKEWSAGYLLEIGVRSNRLNRTDQNHAHGFSTSPTVAATQDAGGIDMRQSTLVHPEHELRPHLGRQDRPGDRAHHRDQSRQDQLTS